MFQSAATLSKTSLVISFIALFSITVLSAAHAPETASQSSKISILQSGDQNSRTYVVNGKRFSWGDLTNEQKETIAKLEQDVEKVEEYVEISERRLEEMERILEEKADKLDQVTEKLETIEQLRASEGNSVAELEKVALQMEQQALSIAQAVQAKEVEMRELEEKLHQLDLIDMTQLDEASEKLDALLIEIAESID